MLCRLMTIVALGSVLGCSNSSSSSAAKEEALAVAVSQPLLSPVTDTAEYTGRTDAVETVEIRARVSGYLDKINFKDGYMNRRINITMLYGRREKAAG